MQLGTVAPNGAIGMRVLRGGSFSSVPPEELSFLSLMWHGLPRTGLSAEVFWWKVRNFPNFWRGLWRILVARLFSLSHFYGQLSLVCIKSNGEMVDYGLVSLRVVTTAGVNFLVDAMQGLVEPEILKFHGLGTGTNAEAAGDTALQTELTTEYNPNNTRATGSLTEGASANIFRTVGTNTVDGSAAVTEHGILSDVDVGEGTLLDRSVFSVINLANGDSLQSTYDFTINSGG